MNEKEFAFEVKRSFPALHGRKRNRFTSRQYHSHHFSITSDDHLVTLDDCDDDELIRAYRSTILDLEFTHDEMCEYYNLKPGIDNATGRTIPIVEIEIAYFIYLINPRRLRRKFLDQLKERSVAQLSMSSLLQMIRQVRLDYEVKYGGVNAFSKSEWHKLYLFHIAWELLKKNENQDLKRMLTKAVFDRMSAVMQLHSKQLGKQRFAKQSAITDSDGRVFARKLTLYPLTNAKTDEIEEKQFRDLLQESEYYMATHDEDYYTQSEEIEYLEDEYD